MPDAYVASVERSRREKDVAFRTDPHSPIPRGSRATFKALRYYPVDARWRFRVTLARDPNPKVVVMQTSGGDTREYLDLGTFPFRADGKEHAIHAYWSEQSPSLFIPFRDATSGKETYGAGRYLDIEWEGPEHAYDLDFNLAYNPYCAYSEEFTCPFPPRENWLTGVAIAAGEKDPEGA